MNRILDIAAIVLVAFFLIALGIVSTLGMLDPAKASAGYGMPVTDAAGALFYRVFASRNLVLVATGAIFLLLRLARLTGEPEYERRALGVLRVLAPIVGRHPHGFGHVLQAIDFYLAPVREVAIAGDSADLAQVVRGAYRPHVVFTRFVAPAVPAGAWRRYYELWPFALQPPDARIYELVDEFAGEPCPTMEATTFGKVGDELNAILGGGRMVLAGVSTDCCVLSTALAAADDGVEVQVVADACAGIDDESHAKALDVMRLYSPLEPFFTKEWRPSEVELVP